MSNMGHFCLICLFLVNKFINKWLLGNHKENFNNNGEDEAGELNSRSEFMASFN